MKRGGLRSCGGNVARDIGPRGGRRPDRGNPLGIERPVILHPRHVADLPSAIGRLRLHRIADRDQRTRLPEIDLATLQRLLFRAGCVRPVRNLKSVIFRPRWPCTPKDSFSRCCTAGTEITRLRSWTCADRGRASSAAQAIRPRAERDTARPARQARIAGNRRDGSTRSRDRLAGEQRQQALTAALASVNAAFLGDPLDVRTWPRLDPILPHARVVAGFADEHGISASTARLLDQIGVLLSHKALYAEAEPLMRRALAIDESS